MMNLVNIISIAPLIILGILVLVWFIASENREQKIKFKNLEDEIDNYEKNAEVKNDFNNLSADEQSNWMLSNLWKKRDKAKK